MSGELEQGRQWHPRSLAKPIASSPAPAGSSTRASCTRRARSAPMSRNGASDVFGMYQNLVEGREVPWELLVKDMPEGEAPGPRLHRGPTRLGKERRSEIQGTPLPRARARRRYAKRRLSRSLDRLWQSRRRTIFHRQGTHRRAGREGDRSRTTAPTDSSASKAPAGSTASPRTARSSSASTNSPRTNTSSPRTAREGA